MKIYLDDVRQAPEGWTLMKTAGEAIAWLKTHIVEKISLDHDLGDGQLTGYDVVCWIERAVFTQDFIPPKMYCHSMNSVGSDKIMAAIKKIEDKICEVKK